MYKSSTVASNPCTHKFVANIGALFHQFDLARPPLLSEVSFEWTVEAQEREPTFAGHGLYPVPALDARWLRGTEVNRR